MTVLCGRSGYGPGGGVAPAKESYRGVTIRRLGGTRFGKRSAVGRLADYLSFYLTAGWGLFTVRRPDVFLVESTPPLIVAAAATASRMRRVPLVHTVQDLYPEVACALGAIHPHGFLSESLSGLHRWALGTCSRVVALGEDMRRVLRERYGLEGVEIIPNWADSEAMGVDEAEVAGLREAWGLSGRKVVMYSGNMGRGHTFDEVLAVARGWRDRADTAFLFVGGGERRAAIQRASTQPGGENIFLRPYQDRVALGSSLAVGDVHLITQRPETEGLIVPSKLYGILGVGRPVVFVGPEGSEVARTLSDSGAGITVKPGDRAGLERALRRYLEDPGATRTAGEAGRSWLQEVGDRRIRTAAYEKVFREVAGDVRTPARATAPRG